MRREPQGIETWPPSAQRVAPWMSLRTQIISHTFALLGTKKQLKATQTNKNKNKKPTLPAQRLVTEVDKHGS